MSQSIVMFLGIIAIRDDRFAVLVRPETVEIDENVDDCISVPAKRNLNS